MTGSTADLHWALPGGGVAAVLLALAVGSVCLLLAARALRRRPGSPPWAAWGAAGARAAAAALAVLAAAGPALRTSEPRAGETASAVASDTTLVSRDARTLRWPSEAPDAAAALETLRAAAAPDVPLDLTLVPGETVPTGEPVERALRRSEAVRTSVLGTRAPPASTAEEVPAPPPTLAATRGATEGAPVRIEVVATAGALPGGEMTLRVGEARVPLAITDGARRATTEPFSLPVGIHLAHLDVPGRAPAVTWVQIGSAPRVAYVADGAASHPLPAVLAAQGLELASLDPAAAAREGLGAAEVIVLGPGARGAALAARVAGRVRTGTGLLVLGGADDSGLRRLAGASLEDLLPVVLPEPPEPPPPPPPEPPEPQPPSPSPPEPPEPGEASETRLEEGPKDALRVALLLVVDRSGSMAGAKIRLAQMAALAATRSLSAEDRVGVLAFDDRPQWIAPFQDAGDVATLARRLGGLRASGGTDFFPALEEGFDEILRQRCGIRHVILLTDGATRAAVFRPTVSAAAERGVTLSTVAIGDGADTRLLGLLAGWGAGRLYLATDPSRLPEVVTVDTRRFTVEARDRLREEAAQDVADLPRPTEEEPAEPEPAPPEQPDEPAEPGPPEPKRTAPRVPRILTGAAFLEGLLDATWPPFPHPEEPRVRGLAQVVLEWENGVPALVLGRYGEARVAVLAADTATADAADVLGWDRGPAFLAQLVRALAPPPDTAGGGVVATETRALDGSARIAVPLDEDGTLRLRHERSGTTVVVACERAGGRWTAGRLPEALTPGVLTGLFVPSREGAPPRPVALVSAGAARSPVSGLDELARRTGAEILSELPAPRPAAPRERHTPVTPPLLGAAVLLLVAEAAIRRRA